MARSLSEARPIRGLISIVKRLGLGSAEVGTMWLSKPIYEILPYYYIAAGLLALAASTYLDHWYWPVISLVMGFACLIAGLAIWLKRKDYRTNNAHLRDLLSDLDD